MMEIFGTRLSRDSLARLVPDITCVAGIRHFREENGPGAGGRVIRIESGGGLRLDLLPDRCCDIGEAWHNGTPFGWIGPIGTGEPARMGGNSPLSGLMTTCGFDHIRQPEEDEGRRYRKHGSMMHQGAVIRSAEPVWDGDTCLFRVVAEVTEFDFDRGGVRLVRTIEVPLGGRRLMLRDEVTVIAAPLPVMAMYHVNLGYPLAGADSRLTLAGADVTDPCLGTDGVRTRPAGDGKVEACLSQGRDGPRFGLTFDADELPIFQTLRNAGEGINLVCLEPASHERLPRAELRRIGDLAPLPVGTKRTFNLMMSFSG